MGVSFNGHAGAIDWIQSRFKKGRPATLYFDEIRTPAYTDCLNRLYERVLASDLSRRCTTPAARGRCRSTRSRKSSTASAATIRSLLMGCPRREAGPIPPRAGDVTMNSTALCEALGDEPLDAWPYDASLVPTHRDWHHERNGEPGSRELLARSVCTAIHAGVTNRTRRQHVQT